MTYQNPKTNWTAKDGVTMNDFNRIEGNILDLHADSKIESFLDEVELFYDVEPLYSDKINQMHMYLEGDTKINLLGYAGNGDTTVHWEVSGGTVAIDTTTYAMPTGAFKLISGGSYSALRFNILGLLDRTKYYCLTAYCKNYNLATGLDMTFWSDGMSPAEFRTAAKVTDNVYFRRLCLKLDGSKISTGATFAKANIIATGASGQYGWVDCIMLEEISASDYNDPLYEPTPYVPAAWSVGDTPVYIRALGKNLYNACEGATNDYAANVYNYMDRLTHKYGTIPVEPNHTYTLSSNKPSYTANIREFDRSKVLQNSVSGIPIMDGYQITTGPNTYYISVVIFNGGTIIQLPDVQVQLEDGDNPSDYEPYKETIIEITQPLRRLPLDICDTLDYDGILTKRVGYAQLDLTTDVAVNAKGTYATRIAIPVPDTLYNTSSGSSSNFLMKYNGKRLTDRGILTFTAALATEGISFWSNGYAYWDVLNSESGWGASYTPTKMEIQAFLAGWQMYDTSTGTVPYNRTDGAYKGWRYLYGNINGQGAIPTYTTTGWIYNRIFYRLATPIRSFAAIPLLKTEDVDRIVVDGYYQYFTRPRMKYIQADNLKANLDLMMKSLSRVNRTVNQLMSGGGPYAPIGYGPGQDLSGVQYSDCNNAIKTGMYFINSNDPNKPVGVVNDGAVLVMAYNASYITQMYLDWRTNRTYRRSRNAGTWTGWTGVPMTHKVVAATLQDAMLPSGFYTNAGDGLPNPNGQGAFIGNWWHILHSHHYDENGYGAQLALPFYGDSEGASGAPWFRSANGQSWNRWKRLAYISTYYITLLNGWTFWSGWGKTYITKIGNMVFLDIMVYNATTSASVIFQLPTGWLPVIGTIGAIATGSNTTSQVWIETNGQVHLNGTLPANGQWIAIKAFFECTD